MNFTRTSRRTRISLSVVAVAASAVLITGGACASGIPVVDLSHIVISKTSWFAQYGQMYSEYVKQLEQLSTQINQLQTQVQQYQQMMVKGTAYKPAAPFREDIDQRFPERDINEGVIERCGDRPSSNPVGPQQYGYCTAMMQTQNRRYNVMRQLLKDVSENDRQLEAARSERDGIPATDQGALQANTNKQASIQSKMQNDFQNAKYTLDAYDAVLRSLNADQVRSAKTALTGKQELASTVVHGAALKLALQAARLRER